MDFFDCNCGFGVPAKPFGSVFATPSELVAELDFCGVAEALVFHVAQREESPQAGNRLVLEASEREPRLHPTWTILPPQADREAGAFLDDMRRDGIRALRAYPEECHYLLNGVTFAPLLEELVPRRVPLIVGPRWPEVTALLGEFPELTLIVVNHSDWGDDRLFRPLIERYPRLHLDTSNYQLERGIADFVRRYGYDRLLYGSGSPNLQMGAALLTLAHADIPDDAKSAIAGGNLRRLLAEVQL
ncbi:MAG: amidohydrolase family protein [Armatimonadota bacterium]